VLGLATRQTGRPLAKRASYLTQDIVNYFIISYIRNNQGSTSGSARAMKTEADFRSGLGLASIPVLRKLDLMTFYFLDFESIFSL
jgi:hypothetical protein